VTQGSESAPASQGIPLHFRGTVVMVGAATMAHITPTADTIIVRVDEVLDAPDALSGLAGQEITVELPAGEQAQVAQQREFVTTARQFGDSILVESAPAAAAPRARVTGATPGPEDARLSQHVADADLVVSGEVTSVRMPSQQAIAAATPPSQRFTEHRPDYQVAVVRVDNVEKGQHTGDEVPVVFASSEDVAWHRAPKFRPGQKGVFVLHRTDTARSLLAADTADAAPPASGYAALDPEDFHPVDQVERIRQLAQGTH